MKYLYLILIHALALLPLFMPSMAGGTPPATTKSSNKNAVKETKKAKAPAVPQIAFKGKVFKIKTLAPISLKAEGRVDKPMGLNLPVHPKLTLPLLQAGPSPVSPAIPNKDTLVKLSPLIRFSLKTNWAGHIDTRLSPQWTAPEVPAADPKVLAMESFTDGEFRILESLLLLKSQDTTPLAAGLAHPLLKFSETRQAAHEILGRGLSQLQIRTASQEHFKGLLKEDKNANRAKRALGYALNAFQANDFEDTPFFTTSVQKWNLPAKDLKNLPLAQARVALEKKDLQSAWDAIARVIPESPQSYEARFLKAMVYYRSNEVTQAKKELESLLNQMQQQQLQMPFSKDLKSLTSATLAQIYFQQGLYKQAFDTYRSVDQEHPLWLETLVESAWSQILLKDYEGAAGNMFSLHTTYFQGAYKPESYIVRTVSYLQLCQFGDALSVLKDFLRKYKFAQKQLQAYKKQNPNHLEIVREFLKAGTPKKFAGLPRSLLVEIARDTKFIELQKKLNEIEEDAIKLEQLASKLQGLDQKFSQAQAKYTQLLQEVDLQLKKSDNAIKKTALLNEKKTFERQVRKNSLLRKIILDSKQGLMAEAQSFTPFWAQRKTNLKNQQNLVLQSSFQNLETDLNHWVDQSELLFYEIHNGAGEHLRYQMATNSNKDDKRSPASEKDKVFKKDDKDLQWAFDGEIWEDEVGHYRSSLKNVCPEDTTTQMGERKPSNTKTPAVANSNESP